jgi:hypothetical protein
VCKKRREYSSPLILSFQARSTWDLPDSLPGYGQIHLNFPQMPMFLPTETMRVKTNVSVEFGFEPTDLKKLL